MRTPATRDNATPGKGVPGHFPEACQTGVSRDLGPPYQKRGSWQISARALAGQDPKRPLADSLVPQAHIKCHQSLFGTLHPSRTGENPPPPGSRCPQNKDFSLWALTPHAHCKQTRARRNQSTRSPVTVGQPSPDSCGHECLRVSAKAGTLEPGSKEEAQ